MRNIKIVLAFFLMVISIGCSSDDNTPFFFEAVSVEEVAIPDQFTRGETVTITTSYFRPSTCHSFLEYKYSGMGNERVITIVNVIVVEGACMDLEKTELIEESFDFFVGEEDSYVFKFWQGRDDLGNDQFLTIEVPVVI